MTGISTTNDKRIKYQLPSIITSTIEIETQTDILLRKKMGTPFFSIRVWFIFAFVSISNGCDTRFDGFGVHLGSVGHFSYANNQTIRNVVDNLYNQLQIRLFRTSLEPWMSQSHYNYTLECTPSSVPPCLTEWETALQIISEPQYSEAKLIASIWSPPYYMKNMQLVNLKREYETQYLYFIHNITEMIKAKYGIEIERISPVNEPENVFAPWDHCNMDPAQLCRMVKEFNSSLINLCTENSYYWVTKLLYTAYKNPFQGIDCRQSCDIIATHSYALNLSPGENFLMAYYDLVPYQPILSKRIWQTEVSSTYRNAHLNQMQEGLDLATNIINFVGITCVERYYFWFGYTNGYSGESLIWGYRNDSTNEIELIFPKKYFVYNQFTNASNDGNSFAKLCRRGDFLQDSNIIPSEPSTTCLKFNSTSIIVFLNKNNISIDINPGRIDCSLGLCCTTNDTDYECIDNLYILPPRSVCTCKGVPISGPPTTTEREENSSALQHLPQKLYLAILVIFAISYT